MRFEPRRLILVHRSRRLSMAFSSLLKMVLPSPRCESLRSEDLSFIGVMISLTDQIEAAVPGRLLVSFTDFIHTIVNGCLVTPQNLSDLVSIFLADAPMKARQF